MQQYLDIPHPCRGGVFSSGVHQRGAVVQTKRPPEGGLLSVANGNDVCRLDRWQACQNRAVSVGMASKKRLPICSGINVRNRISVPIGEIESTRIKGKSRWRKKAAACSTHDVIAVYGDVPVMPRFRRIHCCCRARREHGRHDQNRLQVLHGGFLKFDFRTDAWCKNRNVEPSRAEMVPQLRARGRKARSTATGLFDLALPSLGQWRSLRRKRGCRRRPQPGRGSDKGGQRRSSRRAHHFALILVGTRSLSSGARWFFPPYGASKRSRPPSGELTEAA